VVACSAGRVGTTHRIVEKIGSVPIETTSRYIGKVPIVGGG
jgi:hypothetical protein